MSCRIEEITFKNQVVRLLPSSLECNGEDNVYTLLVGNNGCGKTRILKALVGTLVPNEKGQVLYKVFPLKEDSKPSRVIVITNTLGDGFPADLSTTVAYNSLNYICLGSRVSTGAYSKRHILERSLQILLEEQLTIEEKKAIANIFHFVGYSPSIVITYQLAPKYKSKSALTEYLNNAIHNGLLQTESKPFAIYRALTASTHELFWNIEESENIDFHSGLRNHFPDHESLINVLLLLRRQGVLTTKRVQVRKTNSQDFSFDYASSGESNLLTSLIALIKLLRDDTLVLIDEPELSMHPKWQAQYMPLLQSIVSQYHGCHVVIATHSHFFASDLEPKASTVVKVSQDDMHRICTSLLDYTPYAWSAENILLEVFSVPSTRNYYFAQHLQNALDILADKNRNRQDIVVEQDYIASVYGNLRDYDPLKQIAKAVIDYGKV